MTVAERRPRIMEVIERYGKCLELVPIDPHFHDISVALYEKDGTATVWTFSRREGVEGRIRQIRDQIAALGYMEPVDGTYNQLRPPCGVIHYRPLKFLMMQAVEKDPSFTSCRWACDQGPPVGHDAVVRVDRGRWTDGVPRQGRGGGAQPRRTSPRMELDDQHGSTVGISAIRGDGADGGRRSGLRLRGKARSADAAPVAVRPERQRHAGHA